MSEMDYAAGTLGHRSECEPSKRDRPVLRISDADASMRLAVIAALLVAFVLFAGVLRAQRVSGTSQGHARASGPGVDGHSGLHQHHPGGRDDRKYANLYPVWYDEPYEEEQTLPPATITQPGRSRPVQQGVPVAGPKMIELPGTTNSGTAVPLRPAVFILTNGTRFETRRYLLTHDNLYATIGREQRSIPLAMLDINASIAADHERGIDLRIPADRSEILLGF